MHLMSAILTGAFFIASIFYTGTFLFFKKGIDKIQRYLYYINQGTFVFSLLELKLKGEHNYERTI